MTTEERLSRAHRLAAEAIGVLSLSLASKHLTRSQLAMCHRLLGEAREEIAHLMGLRP